MIFEKVKEILVRQLKVKDPDKITMDTDIETDLKADSIDVIELLMELEDTYNITVPSEKALELKRVGDLVDFLTELTK